MIRSELRRRLGTTFSITTSKPDIQRHQYMSLVFSAPRQLDSHCLGLRMYRWEAHTVEMASLSDAIGAYFWAWPHLRCSANVTLDDYLLLYLSWVHTLRVLSLYLLLPSQMPQTMWWYIMTLPESPRSTLMSCRDSWESAWPMVRLQALPHVCFRFSLTYLISTSGPARLTIYRTRKAYTSYPTSVSRPHYRCIWWAYPSW